jgi:hypothetical protein
MLIRSTIVALAGNGGGMKSKRTASGELSNYKILDTGCNASRTT